MSGHIVKNPVALYYNGELIGIITNPDPHGSINSIVDALSPDGGLCDVRPLNATQQIKELLDTLNIPETIPVDDE